jgi:hypothetical protein
MKRSFGPEVWARAKPMNKKMPEEINAKIVEQLICVQLKKMKTKIQDAEHPQLGQLNLKTEIQKQRVSSELQSSG